MRDLEIRGAGNLLGAEQHGHMESVGYDLYCKMLSEAVKEAKDYINGAVAAGRFLHLGKGMYGPFNHLYRCYPCQHH